MNLRLSFNLESKETIKIPKDYDYETLLTEICSRSGFFPFDKDLDSKNFPRTGKIETGNVYQFEVFTPKKKELSNQKCLDFLHEYGSVLVGLEGLVLAYKFELVMRERTLLSFGDKQFFKNEELMIPRFRHYSSGGFNFGICPFNNVLYSHFQSILSVKIV